MRWSYQIDKEVISDQRVTSPRLINNTAEGVAPAYGYGSDRSPYRLLEGQRWADRSISLMIVIIWSPTPDRMMSAEQVHCFRDLWRYWFVALVIAE
ncbi:hypothetical protein ElyMa_005160800 [Elysia marginata]|uniref:Uncharacterized protein n=1 Tax=Elysia marginata TaxID=1093978 RepID=A0AAV4JRH0_9GAST|nr:hypothetical protein ElyMa_005160800 [Elysia marginata]